MCLFSQVRDRATLHLAELNGKAGGLAAVKVQWNIPAKNLEKSLRAYLENGTDAPFDMVSAQLSCILRYLQGQRRRILTQMHGSAKESHAHIHIYLGRSLLRRILKAPLESRDVYIYLNLALPKCSI